MQKGNDDKTSQAERFSSLRKLFNKSVLKPKYDVLDAPSKASLPYNRDSEEDLARYERKDEGERVEAELSETLKDWTYNTKLSVAVAGTKGVGKSLLINTLLETTYEDKQASQNMAIEGDKADKPYRPRSGYGFSSSAETNNDQMHDSTEGGDWLNNASSNPYRPRSNVKKYNQATAYTFEGTFDPAPATKPQQGLAKSPAKPAVGGLGILDVYKDLDKKALQRSGGPSKVTAMDEDSGTDEEEDFLQMQINKPRKSTYKRATTYIFDDNAAMQTTSAPKKEFEFDVPQIDKTFEMDDDFVQHIDWEKERNNKNEYKDFMTTNQLRPDDSKPFLLPQGEGGAPSFMLRYGKVPEAIISFPKDGELRLALWELHEIAIGTKRPQSEEHLASLQHRYRRLLGLVENAVVPLPNIAAPQDLPLLPEVKALLGKNYRFAGRGRDPEEDRIYIREKLIEVSKKYGDYMCRLMVRVPAGLLEGNKELIEVSGVYSSDLNTKLALQNANLLMIAVDRKRGITGDLAALVKNSGLAEKLLSDPEQHKAIFMELEEKSKVVLPHEMLDSMDDDKFQQFKEGLSVQWKQVIRQSIPTALNNAPNTNAVANVGPNGRANPFAAFSPENVDKLVNEQTSVISVKPVLFSAIHNKDNFPSEMLEGLNVRQVLSKTSIPSVISTVPNRAIAKAAKPVKELSNMILNQIQHEAQMLKTMDDDQGMHIPGLPSGAPQQQMSYEPKIERMITEFGLIVAQFKTDLSHRATVVETGLVTKTKEFVKQQNESVARNIRRSTSSSGLNNNNRNTSPQELREEDLMELERFEHLNIEESTPVPIIDIATAVWKNLIQEIPTKIDKVLVHCTQMLRESSFVIVTYLSDQSIRQDEEKKTRLRKLDEFLRLSHEKVVQRLNVLDQVFRHDPSNLIREACIAALPAHRRQQQVLEYGGDEALKASANVKKKFGDVITIALDHLSQLEKDLVKVIRTVLLALKSQNFTLSHPGVTTIAGPTAGGPKMPALGLNNNNLPSSVVTIPVPGDTDNRKRKRTTSISNNESVVFDSMMLPQVQDTRPSNVIPSNFGPNNTSLIQQAFMNNNMQPRQPSYTTVFNKDVYSQLSSLVVPDYSQFLQTFVDRGYRIDEVKYDGNQQFRALAHQIYGTEHSHSIVRMLIASEILANPNLYEKYIDIPGVDLQEYVQIMSREGMKGDHLTLTAFVNYYGVDLLLYSPAIEHPVLIQSRKNVAGNPKTLQLLVLADHYRSLVSLKEVLLRNKLEAFRTQTMMKLMHKEMEALEEDSDEEGEGDMKRQFKRAKASDDPLQRVHERKQKKREKKMKLSGLGPASLGQLCLERIVQYIDYFESFSGKLPQELLYELLAKLGQNKKLSDKTIAKVLDPSLQRFVLKGPCGLVTDLTMFQLSRRCKGLQELHLVNCFTISDRSLLQVIPNSPELEHIVINNCPQIGNITVQEIARNCPKLTSFTLIECVQVTDVAIQELTLACPLLVNLVISRCPRITDVSLMYPPRGLQVLTLADCPQVTDATATALARNCGASLRAVRFGRHVIDAAVDAQSTGSPGGTMKITDQGISLLAAASPGLEAVTLTAQCGDAAVAALGHHCKNLLTLDATGSQITDRALAGDSVVVPQINQPGPFMINQPVPIMNNQPAPLVPVQPLQPLPQVQLMSEPAVFPYLQKLVLAHCVAVTDATVLAVARHCPELKHLNVAHCERLTDESIVQIAEKCPRLSVLDVTKCTNLTDRSITAMARYCRDLKKINMANCNLVSTLSLEELATNCRELVHLNVSRCDGVTDGTLVKLGMNCPLLQILELEDCANMTENGIIFVAGKCARLTVLKIGFTASLTDNGLVQISLSCPQIRELDLSQCQQITTAGLQRALENLPVLSKLNVMGCRGVTRLEQPNPHTFLAHPPLEEINLSWCQNIDDQAIDALSLGCPNLIKVDLAWCNRFAGTSLPKLVQQCTSLKYINLRGCTKISQLTIQYLSTAGVFIWR